MAENVVCTSESESFPDSMIETCDRRVPSVVGRFILLTNDALNRVDPSSEVLLTYCIIFPVIYAYRDALPSSCHSCISTLGHWQLANVCMCKEVAGKKKQYSTIISCMHEG